MWEQDWSLLGIAPTTELAAIKKAYALKLRVTRPDDDAEAYQALRGAYERAQQWLKWQQEAASEASEEPAAAPLLSEPPTEPAAAPVEASEPLTPPELVVQPQHLIDELSLRWRRSGESALLHEWSAVQRELDQQPLSRHVEFSAAFAQWVLGTPALPDDFLKALNNHFGWLDDFRTERQLGTPLAHALHEALDGRLRPMPVPEAVRELAAPLQAMAVLYQEGAGWWRQAWLFFLLQPLLVRHRAVLGGDWLRRLDLPDDWLVVGIKRGLWLRVALGSSLCWAAGLLIFNDAIIALGHTLLWLVGTGLFMVASLMAGTFIGVGPTLTTRDGRLTRPLEKWRRHSHQPLLGLVWLLFAAWLAYLDASHGNSPKGSVLSLLPREAYQYAGWGFAIAGLLVAWPLDVLRGCVVFGLMPLAGYFGMALVGAWLPLASGLMIGAAWLLAGAAVHEDRFGLPESTPVRWLVRPVLNSLVLADRWSFATALLPLAVAAAWAVLADRHAGPTRIFVVWVLSILATGWLQTRADALGLRQLRATAPD
ncbi:hypothetical protein [Roseateles sp.]|uniref:hypothetical protein n=1 Tax=Roseateles sp. TaxID=1971397 RepID=UPI003265DED2